MSKYIIYTDGASKGNPGDAGIGVIISTDDGKPVREIADYIGKTTNNVAEYKALIRGLQECLELGANEIEICTDSELLERQITGIYKVKSENLKPLYAEVMSILKHFKRVSISHILREFNKRADQLANEGVQKKHAPPAKVRPKKVIEPIVDAEHDVQGELEF
ncbi:MAG: ribonuclease HI family protein [Armatimonadetes bacterium]|nr:ribonuclease HI family protein [Armatimonadota bacterium]